MASNASPTLMNIPLEVRHQIYEHVAKRDTKPEKLLRYWFEKKEVKGKTAELLAKDPNAGTPKIVYEGDRFEAEEFEGESEEESDAEEDSDEEEDGDEGGDEEDEEEDEVGDENEAEEQNEEMMDDDSTAVPAATVPTPSAPAQSSNTADIVSQQATTHGLQDSAAVPVETTIPTSAEQAVPASSHDLIATFAEANAAAMTVAAAQGSATAVPDIASGAPQPRILDGAEEEDVDADMAGDEEVNGGAQDDVAERVDSQMEDEEEDEGSGGNEDTDGDSDEDMEGEPEDQDTGAGTPQPLPVPVVTAHRKWRHIPKFMRITHCPPPVELFLASKQLNVEAKNWFYDVAVLHVDATGSFAHTSFFEEALSQITEATFSPMEDVRKVEVTFVWDSTWLRSDRADCAAAIFPALLRQRAIFVTSILALAPNLSEVTIHWHDSAEDEEAFDLMNDVLVGFLGLDATVKVEPHYIAADAMPYRNSIAGKQRVEFQRIVNNGLNRLF
ncbi:hypothetical protein E8E12_002599 [Didymella heteroderae]|uniref:Uncharacterized protein n=1 Tax=Didymella heteroderae TaxID=1769908 RepID=A0A9P4WWS1_9PLEO|nr:hypothetical protein E8E12_002599 [Didymella heteroderae]